jgi:hypothetical protein
MLDSHLLHALHVQAVRHSELPEGSTCQAVTCISSPPIALAAVELLRLERD